MNPQVNSAPGHFELDILYGVFEEMLAHGDRRSLARSIRVCRAWADVGSPLLWRAVTAGALVRITDPHRRQLYASIVRTLHGDRRSFSEEVQQLAFPRLRALSLDPGCRSYNPYMFSPLAVTHPRCVGRIRRGTIAPFLQPALELLECSPCELLTGGGDPLLARLAAECPRLRQLCMLPGACADGFTSEGANAHVAAVAAVVAALPAIQSLYLPRVCIDDASASLYAALARHTALTSLRVERLALVPPPVAGLHPPFRALQELDAEIGIDALARLADAFPAVARLRLAVCEWDGELQPLALLHSLAALRRLRALHLRCEFVPGRLAGAGLVAGVGALSSQLWVLRLQFMCQEFPMDDFSDATLAQLLARLPLLEELVLLMRCSATTPRAFRVAGESCQHSWRWARRSFCGRLKTPVNGRFTLDCGY